MERERIRHTNRHYMMIPLKPHSKSIKVLFKDMTAMYSRERAHTAGGPQGSGRVLPRVLSLLLNRKDHGNFE